jgi:hypothetical protein
MIDDDRLFKEPLSTFFAEFLELFFPAVTQYLERDSLVPMDKIQVQSGHPGRTPPQPSPY